MPRDRFPNLRDQGRTCDYHLARLVQNLQRRHGVACVTEAGLRMLFYEDTGTMPGVGTLTAALDRFAALGHCYQEWLVKGGVLPNGDVAVAGMRQIRWAVNRGERQAFLGRWRKGRQKTYGLRVNHRAVLELFSSKREVKRAPAADMAQSEFERRRDEQLAALEELAAELDELTYPPPG